MVFKLFIGIASSAGSGWVTNYIVKSPLFRIAQHLIGLVGLFENILLRRICTVDIGVILFGLQTISFFNLFLGSLMPEVDPENWTVC